MGNPLSPVTSISGNDYARCLDVIRTAEREHWWTGLQQAELQVIALSDVVNHWSFGDRFRWLLFGKKSPQRRDAEFQLKVYRAEYDRILAAHPEVYGMSYVQCQERFGVEALNARKATCIATHTIVRQFGLGEAAAQLLVTAAPEDLPAIAAQSAEISHACTQALAIASGSSDANYAAALLASMPDDQRRAAIAEAQALIALSPAPEA